MPDFDHFFYCIVTAKTVGELLNFSKDREAMVTAIRRLVNDEDALVASRIAMALQYLPEDELKMMLPILVDGSTRVPVGNVMFSNKLKVSCASVLTHLKASEGMQAATALLVEDSWGRNARLPAAARLLLKYQGHAKSSIPTLQRCLREDYAGKKSQWKTLLEETIDKIEKFPQPIGKLRSVKEM